jgi:NAD(P)-dependent dehydrogenase (short-subunit alcohol dehydrogenase family)
MANHKKIAGKITLISGAGSGIGLALAKEFGQKGATIIGADINQNRLDSMLSELKNSGIKAFAYRVDNTDASAVEAFAARVQKEVGAVDILCCNAGVGHGGKIDTLTLDEWKWVIDINLWGAIYLIHFFLPSMIERKQGQVLITASGSGLFPQAGMAPYCMTKAAMVSLSNILRMELAEYNINVSALCPGIINTNIAKDAKLFGDQNKAAAVELYATQGVSPAIVAKLGVKGLMKNKGIIPAPWGQVAIPTLLYRISPGFVIWLGQVLFRQGRNFLGPFLKE